MYGVGRKESNVERILNNVQNAHDMETKNKEDTKSNTILTQLWKTI